MPLAFTHVFEPGQMADAPPLLLLHGTGGDEHDLLPLGRALSPGSPLLSPRGLVNEHGAARFFARLGEGVFDPNEVTQRTHELADFLSGAAKKYSIDLNRLIAVGFSAVIAAFIARDGQCNWLEGAQLLAVYTILALAFYFIPK